MSQTAKNESLQIWKEKLAHKIHPKQTQLINDFETSIHLKKQGKIDDRVFAETRLRLGVYGQRYDNGHRNDGTKDQEIFYPTLGVTKGANTVWDAPGMQRIKIPYGGLTTQQMETLAEIAEEYGDDILHVTTRQDFQIHNIHIEDTPTIFRRLAGAGLTTHESCGNVVRNITACPYLGVCPGEAFDATPHAHALTYFLMGHPDCQDFGRKFKISFSGCPGASCGQAKMHDIGFVAQTKNVGGIQKNGFQVFVGGGLGAIPVQAKVFDDFLPEEDLFPFCQAVARVFARHGEKANRNRARMKFLVVDWGLEKFKETVLHEMKTMPRDRYPSDAGGINDSDERVHKAFCQATQFLKRALSKFSKSGQDQKHSLWLQSNTRAQKQDGFHAVTINLPIGDITVNQMRKLAKICRKYVRDSIRTTIEQNLVLRWVRTSDLSHLYEDLQELHLAEPEYGTILDIVACPGTDTCKLGIASSRGLAKELREQLLSKKIQLPESVRNINIKLSGCYNSCSQHHLADIGFYGVGRKVGNHTAPFFQLVLGGQRKDNASSFGLAILAIPAKAVPKVIERLTHYYDKNKIVNETFQDFVNRVGKIQIKAHLDDLTTMPSFEENASYYQDWGDVRIFSKKDIGAGECAGEIISTIDFALTNAEREVFEAQIALDEGNLDKAHSLAYQAMLTAATGVVKNLNPDVANDDETVKTEFKTRLVETKIFLDPFAGSKFANYFLTANRLRKIKAEKDGTHQFIEEAQLFIEACHSYHAKKDL